jgi:hypothetical protein
MTLDHEPDITIPTPRGILHRSRGGDRRSGLPSKPRGVLQYWVDNAPVPHELAQGLAVVSLATLVGSIAVGVVAAHNNLAALNFYFVVPIYLLTSYVLTFVLHNRRTFIRFEKVVGQLALDMRFSAGDEYPNDFGGRRLRELDIRLLGDAADVCHHLKLYNVEERIWVTQAIISQ